MLSLITLAGTGAAIGALSRYGIMRLALPLNRWSLPFATLFINLTGALLLGWILTSSLSPRWQVFLGTGIMGGYTTFSTMINEIVLLGRNQHQHTAWQYLMLSLIGGLLMVYLGTLI
ncbi:CrcB family protein [Lactiplantibacillus paraplantarum]|uniref:fluoride efflux transporter FluC n=1 Tax=Lactiplantibacillus paraplantarum TaxID=60520 RepID=UPI0021A744DD|nr:CrcB family protein [Lactiplantibacillus paraplantarum]MCT4456445.1 CrcB family protein [Lactiplantibacillus paraplantarum]